MAVEVGQAYIPVKPDLSGFGKDVDRQTAGAMGSIKSFAKNAALALGGAFAITKGIDYLRGAVGAASSLNETVSKARTIFGPAAADLEKWASNSAKAFGQSKQGAIDAAATFGNLFVQLGVGSDQARVMSQSMVELASDFASFHDANPEEVIMAQTAAFRGEYDALQRFVPTINAAAVEQEALAMTGKKTTKELNLQEKALAVQSLMMKGAGDAAGDFARTSDSLANKQRTLGAQMTDLKTRIGQGLLPIVSAITSFISTRMLPAFESIGRFVGDVVDNVKLFVNAFRSGFTEDEGTPIERIALAIREVVMPAFKTIADFVQTHWKVIALALAAGITGAVVAFHAMAAAAAAAAAPVTAVAVSTGVALAPVIAIGVAIAAVVGGLIYAYQHFQGFRDVVDGVVAFLMGTVVPAIVAFASYVAEQFSNLVGWVQANWASIQEAISHVVNVITAVITVAMDVISVVVGTAIDFIAALWRAWGDDLLRIAKTMFDYIKQTIENVLNIVKGIIQTVLAIINGDWGKAWDGIKLILSAVWDQIKNIISTALGLVKSIIGGVLSTVGQVWSGALNGMKDLAKSILDKIVGFFTGLPGALRTALATVGEALIFPFKLAFNAIAKMWNNTVGKLSFKIPGWVPGIGDKGWDVPNMPTLHSGGEFRAPIPGGEGLALLRDREMVTTPEQQSAIFKELRDLRDDRAPGGPLVHIENFVAYDPVDVDLLGRRLAFASQGAFG